MLKVKKDVKFNHFVPQIIILLGALDQLSSRLKKDLVIEKVHHGKNPGLHFSGKGLKNEENDLISDKLGGLRWGGNTKHDGYYKVTPQTRGFYVEFELERFHEDLNNKIIVW